VEVDEAYIGGLEEGVRGRQTETKALVAVACEEDGKAIGRIRLRRIRDASAASLDAFVAEAIEPGSVVHKDGWEGYASLEMKGYTHQVTVLKRRQQSASELFAEGASGVLAAEALVGRNPPGCGKLATLGLLSG
jgi:hypothetical protein